MLHTVSGDISSSYQGEFYISKRDCKNRFRKASKGRCATVLPVCLRGVYHTCAVAVAPRGASVGQVPEKATSFDMDRRAKAVQIAREESTSLEMFCTEVVAGISNDQGEQNGCSLLRNVCSRRLQIRQTAQA